MLDCGVVFKLMLKMDFSMSVLTVLLVCSMVMNVIAAVVICCFLPRRENGTAEHRHPPVSWIEIGESLHHSRHAGRVNLPLERTRMGLSSVLPSHLETIPEEEL